jgi:hypothetical protein
MPHEVGAIDMPQPSIRIDESRHRRQTRKRGEGHIGRSIATRERLVRSLLVVMLHKSLRPLPGLAPAFGDEPKASIPA